MRQAILAFAEKWNEEPTIENAVAKFLAKRRLNLSIQFSGDLVDKDRDILPQIIKRCINLKSSSLCIQGPPGRGEDIYSVSHHM